MVVLFGGQDVTNLPANKRDVGMVFQSYSLFPHMVAWENVAFGLQMRKVGADERKKRALEVLELVGLAPYAYRYARPDVRRPAAAGGAGSCARHPAQGAAPGRASLCAGCKGALAPSRRDPPRPAGSWHHDPVRHP